MALSRIALAAALALFPAAVSAEPDPVETQREIVRSVVSADCGAARGDEIVVCGRREQEEQARRFRVPPSAAYSGRRDTAGGEQRAAMAANDQRCTPIGRDQRCNGGLDIKAVGVAIARGIAAIRARRD